MIPRGMDLEPRLPEALLRTTDSALKERFRASLLKAGLRLRAEGSTWSIRADPAHREPFVLVKPLQNAEGRIRADAAGSLKGGAHIEEAAAREMAEEIRTAYPPGEWVGTDLQGIQLGLLANVDPLKTLKDFVEDRPEVRLYALRTTDRFHFLDVFWRLAADASRLGTTLEQMKDRGRYPRPTAVTGTAYMFCAHMVCSPLTARNQPLAAVFETLYGTQVVAVPEGAWSRPPGGVDWPSGSGYHDLLGSGHGLYKTRFSKIPPHSAREALGQCVLATNVLVGLLNDPAQWITTDGELDSVERQIAWSTLDLGFNAVSTLASEWMSSESLWTSFRALGALEGFWNLPRLDPLFDPDKLRSAAVSVFPRGFLAEYTEDIIENYGRELIKMYPHDHPAERLSRIREIRSVVHGTAARFGDRYRRLDALSRVGTGGLHLLRDIAACWWSSVLFAPAQNARPGHPPWEG